MRRAELSDLQTVQFIAADAFAFHQAATGMASLFVTSDQRPIIERGEVWLLETATDPIGLVVLEDRTDHMHLRVVAVRVEMQGKGFGRRLLEFVDRQAIEAGFSEIHLEIVFSMQRDRLIKWYQRHGYTLTGSRLHPRRVRENIVQMRKSFRTKET